MKKSTYLIIVVLLTALVLSFATQAVIAGEKMPASSKHVNVLLENDRVRVVEAMRPPGTMVPMHTHPTLIAYYFEATTVKHTFPNGKTKVQDIPAGKLIWKPDGLKHQLEIIGPNNQHVLVIELKK